MNFDPIHTAVIVSVESADDMERVKELFLEYARSLEFDLGFQGFAEEVAGLPGCYAPPRGRLLLAVVEGKAAGCVAVREIGVEVCEMKRLYVRPPYRGRGIGRSLARGAIDDARRIGFRTMRLDAIRTMTEAVGLYRSLGFKEIAAYRFNPVDGAVFMEIALGEDLC